MKKFSKEIVILTLLIISMNGLDAQNPKTGPDQIELMKKFLGSWECEYCKDTFLLIENTPFGTGMVSHGHIITTGGDTLDSIIQLYGYDKKADRFIMTELVKSLSVLEISYIRFISETHGEMEVTNTENARYRWTFDFKTPDVVVQQAILDDEVVKEVTLNRVK